MNISETSRLYNKSKIISIFISKTQQLKYKHFPAYFSQYIQSKQRRILLLSILSILFLLLLFFRSIDSFQNTSVAYDFHQENIRKSNLTRSKLVKNVRAPIIFSKYKYFNKTRQPSENVIAFLVPSVTGEIRLAYNAYPRLRERVLQLDERMNDSYTTDVIIFHTGYPFREDLLPIIEGSRRQVEFVNIDHIFYKFSPGFDPHIKDPSWSQKGKWNYHHMCYFWFKQVFEMKIIQRYKYMMRLDDDSQIQGKWSNVFDIMAQRNALYVANQREVDYDYILPGITLIRNVTAAHILEKNLTVGNPVMYADIFNKTIEIPNFWNNFEIVDLSFMRRKEVVAFIRAIDESKGIFLYRWGDAPLRYVTLAVFTNATEVLHREKLGLGYCHPC